MTKYKAGYNVSIESMSDNTSLHVTVSVIIPVYNAAEYLQRCLDSVYQQTTAVFEIIVVNDGSTDSSHAILQENATHHGNVRIIEQTNHGQGFARNRAVEQAKGDYILFLDADDWLAIQAIEQLVEIVAKNEYDVVHFGWEAGNTGTVAHKMRYLPRETFNTEALVGDACDELLRIPNYFSVNNLFRRKFLLANNVKFGEGYVYEDNEFMVLVANKAKTVRFLNAALYIINFHGSSSTRESFMGDKHCRDFISAVQKSFTLLHPRIQQSSAYLANYFLEKFVIYYQFRVPNRFRHKFRHEFVDVMSKQSVSNSGAKMSKFLSLCLRLNVFVRHRYNLFWFCLIYKTRVLTIIRR